MSPGSEIWLSQLTNLGSFFLEERYVIMLTDIDKKDNLLLLSVCYNAKEIQSQLLWEVNDFPVGKL